ncbi:MAG: ester cyclase [Candidatus Promineifilaceae bacterium]|nr:ester cyclase [Candidatus Promineifilaceae bacterium]
MSVASTRKVMKQYWDSQHTDTSMMADDVVFTMMANGDETRGPEAVQQMLNHFYHVAFDAEAETTNEIIGDGKAMVEGYVVGEHIGEFAGIPATGNRIRVPICVVYDVEDAQITQARVYLQMPVLLAQLGVTSA